MKKIILKAGKEKTLKSFHHWVFSGAIDENKGDFSKLDKEGEIVEVLSNNNEILGSGFYTAGKSISIRMYSFGENEFFTSIKENIQDAYELRKALIDTNKTNCYRLINGEGDGIPGIIIDLYSEKVAVVQSHVKATDHLISFMKDQLVALMPKLEFVIEKSDSNSRKSEGLRSVNGFLKGEENKFKGIVVKENDISYFVNPLEGQKTGAFLDQREMRLLVSQYSQGRKVLNTFCYHGWFSTAAMKGGAKSVASVDISKSAIEMAKKNIELNINTDIETKKMDWVVEDVFSYLRGLQTSQDDCYDLIILDPPAFAKKRKDERSALKAYKDINREAMKIIESGGILFTFSCSHFISLESFKKMIFFAALEAGRNVRIIGEHRLGIDHPVNVFHPEGQYLKGLVLYVS